MDKKLMKIFTIIILILPITSQYKSMIPGFSIADLMLFAITLFIILILLTGKFKFNIRMVVNNPFFWFIIYCILGSLISSMTQHYASMIDISIRTLRYIFYIFCATFISSIYFDFNFFIKWYRKLAIFVTIFLFIQVILFKYKRFILMGTIPGFRINNPGYSEEVMRNLYSYFHRPSSVFLEPGYFAQFIIPYLAYTLFTKNNILKHKYIEAIFLTIGLLLSTSGQGIVIGLFLWGMYFMTRLYNTKSKKINLIFILGIIGFIISIPFILKLPIIEKSIDRLFGSPIASSSGRIFRGFAIFGQLNPIYKFIGVGYGNVGAHIIYNNIYTIYDTGFLQSEYMNSIAYILVNLGIIGLILMIWIFVYLWKNTRGYHRICLYILILLSGVSTYFISSGIVFYLPIVLSGFVNKNSIYKNNYVEINN